MTDQRPRVGVMTPGHVLGELGGFVLAEIRLIEALRGYARAVDIEVEVVGGPKVRPYARMIGGHWLPGRRGRPVAPARRVDVRHITVPSVRPPRGTPYVVVIHDLAPLRFPDEGALPAHIERVARDAARVLVPSEFTRGEVNELLGIPLGKVTVVPQGPGNEASAVVTPLDERELRELKVHRPYIVRIGGYTRRKNVRRLIECWPAVRAATGAHLVMAGPAGPDKAAAVAAGEDGNGIVVLDYVTSEMIHRLIAGAAALVSPSIYEGFGFPPLEAMSVGTPVVAVRAAAIAEVCGDAAMLVDDDPATLADALIEIIEDVAVRKTLVEAGTQRVELFSWQRHTRALEAIYLALAGRRNTRDPLPG